MLASNYFMPDNDTMCSRRPMAFIRGAGEGDAVNAKQTKEVQNKGSH